MNTLKRILSGVRKPLQKASAAPKKAAQATPAIAATRTGDTVKLSLAAEQNGGKGFKFKLGTLVHGAIGAVTSMIPVIGVGAITAGSAALPWTLDTEYNNSQHSSIKSLLAGTVGLVGGALLNIGGLTAAVAAGSMLPMIPAAIAGGFLFGKMAQVDSSIGTWDAF